MQLSKVTLSHSKPAPAAAGFRDHYRAQEYDERKIL